MRLTIEQLDNHEGHLKQLLSTFRFSLKVREFKSGGKYAGYHSDGSWRGSFPTALLPNLLAKGHLEESGRETMDGDAFITYRPTLKGHNWWVRHNAAQRRRAAAPAKPQGAAAAPAPRRCRKPRLSRQVRAERRADIQAAARGVQDPCQFQRIADYFGVSAGFVKQLARERAATETP